MTMDQDIVAPRITDVVPANFLCDTQALAKVAESKLLDEKALSVLDEEVSALKARLQGLKDQSLAVEQLIADTEVKQTRFRSSIATHTTLLSPSPIRAISGEVLSEIFLHFFALFPLGPTRDAFKAIGEYYRIQSALLLVCRRWRTTALANPRLWTAIPLVGSGDSQRFVHPAISGSPEPRLAYSQTLEDRISRSAALPLNILFHLCMRQCKDEDAPYLISTFETFIRLFPRAESMSIHLEMGNARLASSITKGELLPAFGLRMAGIDVDDEGLCRKILSAMPNVEVLDIRAVDIGLWFLDAPNVGHHLRNLRVHSRLRLADVLDLLDGALLLHTLTLFRVLQPAAGDNLRIVTHDSISAFRVDVASQGENDAIFQHLTFPSLRSLFCSGEHYRELTWPQQSNLAFLRRSSCTLTRLAFFHCHVNEPLLEDMLKTQSNIAILHFNVLPAPRFVLGHVPISMSFLDFLSTKTKGASQWPVPSLKIIRLAILPRQFKRLKRFIQSRSGEQAQSAGVSRLREVDIVVNTQQVYSHTKRMEQEGIFEEYVNAGMTVSISYAI